jgi:putative addiction module component (TIGR02574 family)
MPEEILDRARALSVEDRIQLVTDIWDTIAADQATIPLDEATKAELDRRLADLDANPDDLLTWDQVRDRVTRPE